MPEFAGFGTTIVLVLAVLLWIAYLVPVWTRRREYLATERNAVRLQQTLRIMAESAEAPEEVRVEVDAKAVAQQQRLLAKEERLKQAMEHARAVAKARELDEQIKAVEREVRVAVKSSMSRKARLRRTKLACFVLAVVAVGVGIAGAIVPGAALLVAVATVAAVLAIAGLVAVNHASARMRQIATEAAPRVHTLVEAQAIAAPYVTAEIARSGTAAALTGEVAHPRRTAKPRQTPLEQQETEEVLRSRSWSHVPVPPQRAKTTFSASDDILRRAREQVAAERREAMAPLAPVARLEPRAARVMPEASFDELVSGAVDEAAEPLGTLEPANRDSASNTAPDRERIAAPAPRSRFASMGVLEDDLDGLDVHAAFARRVG